MTNMELCEFLRDSLKLWGTHGTVRWIGPTIQVLAGGIEVEVRRDVSPLGSAAWNIRAVAGTADRSMSSHSVVSLLRNLMVLIGTQSDGKSLRITRSATEEIE